MGNAEHKNTTVDQRIANRLRALRSEKGWSLDQLGQRSSVSRATLSRLENAEVSATANVLGKLCAAYGLTLSRLMAMVEDDYTALIRPAINHCGRIRKPVIGAAPCRHRRNPSPAKCWSVHSSPEPG